MCSLAKGLIQHNMYHYNSYKRRQNGGELLTNFITCYQGASIDSSPLHVDRDNIKEYQSLHFSLRKMDVSIFTLYDTSG